MDRAGESPSRAALASAESTSRRHESAHERWTREQYRRLVVHNLPPSWGAAELEAVALQLVDYGDFDTQVHDRADGTLRSGWLTLPTAAAYDAARMTFDGLQVDDYQLSASQARLTRRRTLRHDPYRQSRAMFGVWSRRQAPHRPVHERARELKAAGRTLLEIAAALGIEARTIFGALASSAPDAIKSRVRRLLAWRPAVPADSELAVASVGVSDAVGSLTAEHSGADRLHETKRERESERERETRARTASDTPRDHGRFAGVVRRSTDARMAMFGGDEAPESGEHPPTGPPGGQ